MELEEVRKELNLRVENVDVLLSMLNFVGLDGILAVHFVHRKELLRAS